jgi:hypothetical protein
MGIDASLRTESGEELASVPDPGMVLSRAASSASFSESRLLRYLVPWGDAMFNQAQASDLRDDIRIYVEANGRSPASEHLRAVGELVEKLAAETHAYLWFIGD